MKKIWFSFLILASTFGWGLPASADTATSETHFSLVQGKVRVTSELGSVRKVAKGDSAYPGETVQVGSKAQAQLTLFDGSTLDLSPNSKITLNKLEKVSPTDKVISIKLGLGKVLAQVRKLFSSKSSFEIEAGGVVCGVRGTAYSLGIDPKTNKLELDVFEGKVAVNLGGNTVVFTAGQTGHFFNGQLIGTGTNSGNPNSKSGGKGDTNGGNSNGNNSNSNGNDNGNGGNNSNTNDSNGNGNNSGNPNTGSTNGTAPTFNPNAALGDLNSQFTQGILINGDNSLNSAQQNVNIHLVLPGREAVP